MTNDLSRRLWEHYQNRGNRQTFVGKYYCYRLVYYEEFLTALDAINREKEIKDMSREAKIALIKSKNPFLHFIDFKS